MRTVAGQIIRLHVLIFRGKWNVASALKIILIVKNFPVFSE
jgi:hypothetical protein